MIYFAQDTAGSVIKIGTSENVKTRLQQLGKVDLLALRQGGKEEEKELHARFAKDRAYGEWFHPSAELLEYIGSLPKMEIPPRGFVRTSLTIDPETYDLVAEMAARQGRTTANLLQHLIRTNNEVVGWKSWKKREAAK